MPVAEGSVPKLNYKQLIIKASTVTEIRDFLVWPKAELAPTRPEIAKVSSGPCDVSGSSGLDTQPCRWICGDHTQPQIQRSMAKLEENG